MIAGLKPYPEMKDSGVPWLGEVPSTWDMARNGGLFTERKETGFGDLPILEVSLKTGVRVRNLDGSGRKQVMADREKYKRARGGDLAYNMMRMWQGAIGMAPVDGLVSPAYVVAKPFSDVDPRYFEYLFRTDAYMGEVDKFSHGIVKDRNRLYWEEFKQIPSPVPPPDEQTAIVRFLGHADRRIRRYIGAKQKLIKLLDEQKQAIIHRAVTRGLDPKVSLKPSDLESLGNVPAHWEMVRLGRLIGLTTGFPFKSEGFTNETDEIRLLRGINISPGHLRWNNVVRWSKAASQGFAQYELQPGDIVLGMDRPIVHGGVRVAVIRESDVPSLLLQRVARIRPNPKLLPAFLVLLLAGKSFSNYLSPIFTGISVPHLSPEQIKSFRFPLPPTNEQSQIVEQLNKDTLAVQSAIDRAEREISLLREYRTRLIADVVTGKLDVREVAARLPDEIDEIVPDVDDADDVEESDEDDDPEAAE